MRKLTFELDLRHLREIKGEIVPVLFTEHQFCLIEKKQSGQKMTASEKNEFSRAVSRKMNAINKILGRERAFFVYGREKIRKGRLKQAIGYLKFFSRKFKNKHVLLAGSFLYSEKYNDIDVFIVSKYEKDDYWSGKFHINYLAEGVYHSLFFASLRQLCISNKRIVGYELNEKISLDTFISLYQELFNDLDRHFKGVKQTLREFLLQAAFVGNSAVPDSLCLAQQIDFLLKTKKPKEAVKKIFVNAVVLGSSPQKARSAMNSMINSYQEVIKEYKQHKPYYSDLMQAFHEVMSIES